MIEFIFVIFFIKCYFCDKKLKKNYLSKFSFPERNLELVSLGVPIFSGQIKI